MHRRAVQKQQAQENAKKLENLWVKIQGKAGNGKMFGAVSAKDIAEAIAAQHGIEIDKKKIDIPAIKAPGEYVAILKLFPEVSAKIKVIVEIE